MMSTLKVVLGALSLSTMVACTVKERTCEPFDHPSEPIWDPAVVGDVVVFANQTGDELRFELKSTRADGVQKVREGHSCLTVSDSYYYDNENDVGFDVQIRYTVAAIFADREPTPVDQLPIRYDIEPAKNDTFIMAATRFYPSEFESALNNGVVGNSMHQYYPTLTVNGVDYADVLERDSTASPEYTAFIESYPDDVAWIRVMIAKGIGLLQYELLNGEIYTRQSN